jgi:hypothetical protein
MHDHNKAVREALQLQDCMHSGPMDIETELRHVSDRKRPSDSSSEELRRRSPRPY